MSLPFDKTTFAVLTLVYAHIDGKMLMLERAATKAFLPGWVVGLGGKVEPGEDVTEAAKREFEEESGLTAKSIQLRGSYTFITTEPGNRSGVIYIYVVNDIEGTFNPNSPDGTLHWLTPQQIAEHPKIMPDHKVWLAELVANDNHFACIGEWHNSLTPGEWADSRGYFESRLKAA
ncbi:MAG: hypothetical protein DI585_04510 [Pseudomonas fluorescens]|nr:MAG: hypothetical protein DI585_04510 [Pseudomonas fluorescens]